MAKSATKKPVPRSVESLKKLLAQINEYAPNRSKVSDGWIGDAKHAARHSDHNPEPDGTVDARDFTNDPSGGLDSQKLCDALVKSKDPRISYIICNGKIIAGRKGPKPWVPRKYSGANGHYHHIHVSVLDEGQDDKTPWKIADAFKKAPAPKAKPSDLGLTTKQVSAVLKPGSKGEFVEELQKNLRKLGYALTADGRYGIETEAAVRSFQQENKLEVDGWAGPRTLEAISKAVTTENLQPKIDEAEAKVDAAKKVVDENAANGKRISTTEWLAGLVGAGGTVGVARDVANTITETTKSFGEMVVTVGPWLLLGAVVIGGAIYIIRERRQKRLDARAVQKVL